MPIFNGPDLVLRIIKCVCDRGDCTRVRERAFGPDEIAPNTSWFEGASLVGCLRQAEESGWTLVDNATAVCPECTLNAKKVGP